MIVLINSGSLEKVYFLLISSTWSSLTRFLIKTFIYYVYLVFPIERKEFSLSLSLCARDGCSSVAHTAASCSSHTHTDRHTHTQTHTLSHTLPVVTMAERTKCPKVWWHFTRVEADKCNKSFASRDRNTRTLCRNIYRASVSPSRRQAQSSTTRSSSVILPALLSACSRHRRNYKHGFMIKKLCVNWIWNVRSIIHVEAAKWNQIRCC